MSAPGQAQLGCPCIGQASLDAIVVEKNISVATVDAQHVYSAFSPGAVYPSTYGANCDAHDHSLPPYCSAANRFECDGSGTGCLPAWCASSWCWVDANNCTTTDFTSADNITDSAYFSGSGLVYSYTTCGNANLWDAFYIAVVFDPSPPPPPPPPTLPPTAPPPNPPPSPPPAAPPTDYALLVGVPAACAIAALLFLLVIFMRREAHRSRALALARAANEARIAKAVESMRTMTAPVMLINYDIFKTFGRLYAYEEARDAGLLTVLDDMAALSAFSAQHAACFVSHQWLGRSRPDEAHVQYAAIVDACADLCESQGIAPTSLFLWVDYHSINQRNAHLQQVFINALPFFAATCKYFLVAAPSAPHEGGHVCDESTYRARGWCRLEQLARAAVGGTDGMFVVTNVPAAATGATATATAHQPLQLQPPADPQNARRYTLQPLATGGREWLTSISNVFGGEFAVESDKVRLVEPILGLWGMVLAGRHDVTKELYHLLWQDASAVFPPALFGDLPHMLHASVTHQHSGGGPAGPAALQRSVEETHESFGVIIQSSKASATASPRRVEPAA